MCSRARTEGCVGGAAGENAACGCQPRVSEGLRWDAVACSGDDSPDAGLPPSFQVGSLRARGTQRGTHRSLAVLEAGASVVATPAVAPPTNSLFSAFGSVPETIGIEMVSCPAGGVVAVRHCASESSWMDLTPGADVTLESTDEA